MQSFIPIDAKKLKDDGLEYNLTIPYEKESELDKIVNDIWMKWKAPRTCETVPPRQ